MTEPGRADASRTRIAGVVLLAVAGVAAVVGLLALGGEGPPSHEAAPTSSPPVALPGLTSSTGPVPGPPPDAVQPGQPGGGGPPVGTPIVPGAGPGGGGDVGGLPPVPGPVPGSAAGGVPAVPAGGPGGPGGGNAGGLPPAPGGAPGGAPGAPGGTPGTLPGGPAPSQPRSHSLIPCGRSRRHMLTRKAARQKGSVVLLPNARERQQWGRQRTFSWPLGLGP